jgi:hypothetical protein
VHLAGDDAEGLAVESELSIRYGEGMARSGLSLGCYGEADDKEKGEKSLTQIIYSKEMWEGYRSSLSLDFLYITPDLRRAD